MRILIPIATSIALLAASCKSFDPALLEATPTRLESKLPSMENSVRSNLIVTVNPNGNVVGANPQDIRTLFDREVREVITNPYDDKVGYLELKVNVVENKHITVPFLLLHSYTLAVTSLFGVPFSVAKSEIELELDILDQNRKLVGSFRSRGSSKLVQSYYSGTFYSHNNLQRVAYLNAVRQAMDLLKQELEPEVQRLSSELKN